MTRIKEVEPNSGKVPDYKSSASRLVHSLRKGYDNLRGKLKGTREKIKYYQIKTRDLEKSRSLYKEERVALKEKIGSLEKENEKLKEQIESLEIKKKKISQ
jgi:chromosome segregation ATPase